VTVRMLYKQYKQHYSDCKAMPGTYDSDNRTIDVDVPDGRAKPSGVRGQRFHGYQIEWDDGNKVVHSSFRAVCQDNAFKQARREFGEHTYRVRRIFL
jgi:hypothetical protein